MESFRTDLRYALRLLRKNPGFTLIAALVVMLGAASVTTIFSVVNTLLIAPSPGLGEPASLVDVTVWGERTPGPSNVSYPLYRDVARRTRTLSGLAAWANAGADVAFETGGTTRAHEARSALIVSGNYFDVLRVRAAAGRFFRADEDSEPLAKPVVVVSAALAESRLGGAAAAVGREIEVNGTVFTVIGVASPEFGATIALVKPDLYVPGMMASVLLRDMPRIVSERRAEWLSLVGRLAPGVSAGQAQAELTTLRAGVARENADDDARERVLVVRLRPIPVQGQEVVAVAMGVLMTVGALVLLIASLNVGSMLLARGVARRKEFGVRLAIGATQRRLVRQLVTESVVLFLLGGTAGVILTDWVLRLAETMRVDAHVPIAVHFPIDLRVLGFTLAVTLTTGVVFGLFPALAAARRDLAPTLRSDGAGVGDRRTRSRRVFVTTQLAMSVLLLVSAGLFLRALQRASTVDPGFDYRQLAAADLGLTSAGYDSVTAGPFLRELASRVTRLPGVEGATFATMPPLSQRVMGTTIGVPGRPAAAKGERPDVTAFEIVGHDYFRTTGIPLLAGRALDETDVAGASPSVVVSAAFVRRFFPGVRVQQAVGRTFTVDGTTETIVGVARDGRFTSLVDEPRPFVFFPDAQRHRPDAAIVVRARPGVDPASLGPQIQRIVAALDPRLPRLAVQDLTTIAASGLLPQRVAALVTVSLGTLGLLLAAVGVYGLISYGVGQRVREIGVRIALGAPRHGVVRMVVAEGWRLAGIGLVAGLAVATLLSRALARFLLGVSPLDPITLLGVPVVLLGVTLVASWLPARRAARIDVARALRDG
ncbi:permease (plasmid) [Gemmatirosa kalamazoonensis]|uniref:Permease n=1 Tax=Gemmatirosa kalamazoonensis TaxID=861299 RepID=W0RSS5_9BACT|nr:ABC transporter permease [Gemmatirosa kalamazoonensis]AHG93365.1 permease [Gemmatirosa kalamazoonensis]